MKKAICVILIVESFLAFYFLIKYKELISINDNYLFAIEQIRLKNDHLKEKDSISNEQIISIGKNLDSQMILYNIENRIIDAGVLKNRFILYIPSGGCSTCINEVISALSDLKQCNIIILSNFSSAKELLVFRQSIKQNVILLRTVDSLEKHLNLSFKYPFLFKVNNNFTVDFLFYCQSFEMTQHFLKTIATT